MITTIPPRHTRDHYIERVKKRLLKKFPGMTFEVEHMNEKETFVYCYLPGGIEDQWDIITLAGNIATDAVVDGGYQLYVMAGG